MQRPILNDSYFSITCAARTYIVLFIRPKYTFDYAPRHISVVPDTRIGLYFPATDRNQKRFPCELDVPPWKLRGNEIKSSRRLFASQDATGELRMLVRFWG